MTFKKVKLQSNVINMSDKSYKMKQSSSF